MTTNEPLKNYLNKCVVPRGYEGHHLYYTKPIPGDKIRKARSDHYYLTGAELGDYVYAFHIIEPRQVFLKWCPDKYESHYDIYNCHLPWQIFVYTFRRAHYHGYYQSLWDISLVFSHRNILESRTMGTESGRKRNIFPAFLPNISYYGKICLGEAGVDLDYNLKYNFSGDRSAGLEKKFFKHSIQVVDTYFSNLFNADYPNYEADELNDAEDPEDIYYEDSPEWDFSHWYPIGISAKTINTRKFLTDKKSMRTQSVLDSWEKTNIRLPWSAIF